MGRNEGRKEGEEEKIGQKKKSWRQRQCDRNRFLSPQNSAPRDRTQVGGFGKHVRDQRWLP